MDYFRWVSFILAAMLLPGALWFLLAPANYSQLAARILTEKRPGWFIGIWLLMLGWVIYTWLRFIEVRTISTAAVSLILSLTLIKGYYAVLRYETFRNFSLKFVGMGNAFLRVMALLYLAMALALLAAGLSL